MPVLLTCTCGKIITVADEMRGRRGRCKECGETLCVPELEQAPPAAQESYFEIDDGSRSQAHAAEEYDPWPTTCEPADEIVRGTSSRYTRNPRVFVNPSNGHQAKIGRPAFLWCLLFGCFYFIYKSCYKHAFIAFFAAIFTCGISWFVYPFFADACVRDSYLEKGWRPVG